MAQTERAADKTLAVKGLPEPARGRTPFHRWEKNASLWILGDLSSPLLQIMKISSWKVTFTVCSVLQIIIAYPGTPGLNFAPWDNHQNCVWVTKYALVKTFFLWIYICGIIILTCFIGPRPRAALIRKAHSVWFNIHPFEYKCSSIYI